MLKGLFCCLRFHSSHKAKNKRLDFGVRVAGTLIRIFCTNGAIEHMVN
ncbi:MAG: hypothetical protein IKB09_10125 [Oscillospiraceae bacterium]|nr:hypothetical protein [Oscillospiraceae bacterium]